MPLAAAHLPLVLAVHGRDGDPVRLGPLLDTWARAGYVVVSPHFLVTDKDDRDKPTARSVARQAADARFVLDRVLALADDPSSALSGRIDPQHIGAAGMSLGGMTVYGLVSQTCCRDPRIGAAVLLAGVRRDFDSGRYIRPKLPSLLLQGDRDPGYHNSISAYQNLDAPKWFVTLHGSTHSPPFETPRGPEAPIVDATTVAFWNRYLRGDVPAQQAIVDAVGRAGPTVSLRYRA